MKSGYVFIGAGPSTLAAVNALAKADVGSILILDSGNQLSKRGCPGLRKKTCTACNGDACHVIEGIGGASAGFGNKMCHFPASDRVLSLIPDSVLPDVYRQVARLTGLDELVSTSSCNVVPHKGVATRKLYPADILGKTAYQEIISRLVAGMCPAVTVRDNVTVLDVEITANQHFRLAVSDGSYVETANLVIACGRAGHRFLRPVFRKLGVTYKENSPDIGIRLEADTDLFNDQFFYQNDPKYKFTHRTLGSSRTFCACKGGTIVPVKYGQGFFADGAFLDEPSGTTNMALMVRDKAGLEDRQIDEWCSSVNAQSSGSLLVAEVDLMTGSEENLTSAILDGMPWPTETHQTLMAELLANIVLGRYIKMFAPGLNKNNKVRIFGPSVDLYWPAPVLYQGFRTTTYGVSVIGDATGMSRGIVQALASGTGWALLEAERRANWQGMVMG